MQPIGVALLSYGMSGKVFHAPFLHVLPQYQLIGAWERSSKKIVNDYDYCCSFDSLDELLANTNIQLVVVNTPNNTHYAYAKAALQAGKNVVVEKNFTTTLSEANELQNLAKELDLTIGLFHNRRWDSDCLTVQQIVKENLLGDLIEASFYYDRYKPTIGYKLHKEIAGPGAGLLFDLGPHLIDQAIHLFGMPESVFANIRKTRPNTQVDDFFDITLFYPNLTVKLHASNYVLENGFAIALHGTNGSFLKEKGDVQEQLLLQNIIPFDENWGTENESTWGLIHSTDGTSIKRYRYPSLKGNYGTFYTLLYEALTQKKLAPVTAADGIKVQKILDAAIESMHKESKIYM